MNDFERANGTKQIPTKLEDPNFFPINYLELGSTTEIVHFRLRDMNKREIDNRFQNLSTKDKLYVPTRQYQDFYA